jgi:WD40 repeat protein
MSRRYGWLALMPWLALAANHSIYGGSATTTSAENPKRERPVRTDLYGDPLPEGAVSRLGTVRFRHSSFPSAVAFSPDGKVIASGGTTPAGVCLWEAASGRPLHRVRDPQDGRSLAFSPDSRQLVVAPDLSLIGVATGQVVRRFAVPAGSYSCVAYSPDGKLVAAGGNAAVVVLDALRGNQLRRLQGHAGAVRTLAFAPDGKLLVTGGDDQTVRLWDVSTGQELQQLQGHAQPVLSVAFSRGGKVIASAAGDSVIRLWDARTGKALHQLRGHQGPVQSVAFSPDANQLASGSDDTTIRLWEVATGKELRRQPAHPFAVVSVAFSPDGKTLASAGLADHAVRLWDTATGEQHHPAAGHTGRVEAVTFSPDGQALVSLGRDCKLLVWDLETGSVRRRLPGGLTHGQVWNAVARSPDGKLLAQAERIAPRTSVEPLIRLWDTTTGKPVRPPARHGDWVRSLAFSPDGKLLASAGSDRLICVFDAGTGRALHLLNEPNADVYAITFAPDGKALASGGDHTVRLWDVATGKVLRHWDSPQVSFTLLFAPGGKLLAASDRQTILVWDVATGKELRRFGGQGTNRAMAFSPSGRILAADEESGSTVANGGANGIRFWELASGKEIRRLAGDQGKVWSLAFAPDSATVASGGADSTILVWALGGRGRSGRLPRAPLSARELEGLWTDLAGEASKAYRAVWALAAARDQALPLLKERVRLLRPADPARVLRLVADLDSDRFAVREEAARELDCLGEAAAPALRRALRQKPSLEVSRRIEGLLAKLEWLQSPELARGVRAVEVLEQVGTPAAVEVLAALAKGAPEFRLTQEAKASLERLAKRGAASP